MSDTDEAMADVEKGKTREEEEYVPAEYVAAAEADDADDGAGEDGDADMEGEGGEGAAEGGVGAEAPPPPLLYPRRHGPSSGGPRAWAPGRPPQRGAR